MVFQRKKHYTKNCYRHGKLRKNKITTNTKAQWKQPRKLEPIPDLTQLAGRWILPRRNIGRPYRTMSIGGRPTSRRLEECGLCTVSLVRRRDILPCKMTAYFHQYLMSYCSVCFNCILFVVSWRHIFLCMMALFVDSSDCVLIII